MTRHGQVPPEGVKRGRGFCFFLRVKRSPSDGDEKLGIIQQCSEQGSLHYFFFTSE